MDYLYIGGKILFTSVFFISGFMHLARGKSFIKPIEEAGLPAPLLTNYIAAGMLILGAYGVLFEVKYLPYLLILFLGLANMFFHDFWAKEDKIIEFIRFMNNIAMIGTVLMFLASRDLTWIF